MSTCVLNGSKLVKLTYWQQSGCKLCYNAGMCNPVKSLNDRLSDKFLFGSISDKEVCLAYTDYKRRGQDNGYEKPYFPYEFLSVKTGMNEIACFKACERAERRGLIEYGVSLRTGWLTDAGKALL